MAFFVASVLALPRLPGWSILAFLAMIPVFYKFQAWNHKIWTVAADMTEFNKRFPPGRTLNLILLIYEVPICLNYLIFRRQGLEKLRLQDALAHAVTALACGPGRSRCCANP